MEAYSGSVLHEGVRRSLCARSNGFLCKKQAHLEESGGGLDSSKPGHSLLGKINYPPPGYT